MLAQFEVSQREKTANSSRPERSKAGNDEGKEGKSNRSIKISVFTILNLLLLHKSWVFNLVLVPADGRTPGALGIYQGHHFDIGNSLGPGLSTNLIIDEIIGGRRDGKVTSFLGGEMSKALAQFMIIVHHRKVQSLKFFLEG